MVTKGFLHKSKSIKLKQLIILLCLCSALLCSSCNPKPWKLEDKGDLEGLISMLLDESEKLELRTYAASSLGRIGSPFAVDALIQTMQEFFQQEADLVQAGIFTQDNCRPITTAVCVTATALGEIGDPRAVQPLNLILKTVSEQEGHTCNFPYYEDQRSVEEDLIHALIALGDKEAEKLLIIRLVEGLDAYCWVVDRENCPEWKELLAMGETVTETLMELVPVWRAQAEGPYYRAVEVLAEGTDPRIRAVLEREFKATGSDDAMEALGKFLKYDTAQLLPYLESEDTLTMYKLLIRIGEPGTEAALVAALDKFGTGAMADYYFLCGGTTAVWEVGMQWWSDRGYLVSTSKPTSPYGSGEPCGWGVGP